MKEISAENNKKKEILVTFFSHSSHLGGAELCLIELIDELKEKKISSHVVIPNNGPIEIIFKTKNIPYDIVSSNWWASKETKNEEQEEHDRSCSLQNLLNYLPKLKLINPDLIYSNTMVLPWGAIAANQLGKPHIWHIHEYGDLDHKLKFDTNYGEIIRFIESYSDLIIINSNSVAAHVSKHLIDKKPEVIYYNIEIPAKLPKQKVVSPFKISDSLKILVCGTIQIGKNQMESLQIIQQLISKNINVELLILGGITDKNYFQQLLDFIKNNQLTEKVHFVNFVKNPYPYFLLSDIVLIPSHKEAYGRIAVEGMLLKKVVIANSGGGTKEIIKNNETGFIYKSDNLKELEKILIKLTDKKYQKTIALNGYNSLKEFNSKEKYGYKIANLIKKTIQKPSTKNYFNKINNQIIKSIQNEKKILKQENINLKYKIKKIKINREILKLEQSLKEIKSSIFFKIWRIYCKLLKGKK